MGLYRSDVIVLRSRNLGEADRVLVLLSPDHGKFEAVVKGARRQRSQFVGNTMAFSYLKALFFSGRNLDSLSQAELIQTFTGLREDLMKMAYASFWVELVDYFVPERQPAPEVFHFLLAAFQNLETTEVPEFWNLVFQIQLLEHLGYQPQLDGCCNCGLQLGETTGFSAKAGGTLCQECSPQYPDLIPLSAKDLKTLQDLADSNWADLSPTGFSPASCRCLSRVLRSFIEFRLDRPLKAQLFLDSLLAQ